MTANSGGEQFGAIPVRAFGDTRLAAADLRVLGAIAYFDRLGRNGYGCIVDPRRLAEITSVDYSHIARHTRRLEGFGYLSVGRSPRDRRRRIYRVIYNEKPEIVAMIGDNLGNDGDRARPKPEKVANGGGNPAEKVARPNPHALDLQPKSAPKRSCEAELKYPAKQGAHVASRAISARHARSVMPSAWQGETDRSTAPRQKDLRAIADVANREIREQRRDAAARLNARLSGNPDVLARVMGHPDSMGLFEGAVDLEVQRAGAGLRYLRSKTKGACAA